MANILDQFVSDCQRENLLILYAQVRQGGAVIGQWSRFGKGSGNGLSAFSGVSRMESYSLTKSFSSVGIGIAIDEGLISLDEKVADSFKDYTYAINDPRVLDVTVEDMLKMASGLSNPLFFRDSPERATVKDWIKHFFDHGDFSKTRGKDFLYSNFNPYMLGCLVEIKTGRNLLEYMRYRLFEPLGIGNPDMTMCPMGHTVAANGMAINVDELGRFGQMVLQQGLYNGKRVVSSEFIKAATSAQIATKVPDYTDPNEGTLDYGYQFWVDSAHRCSFLFGVFGQFCVISPEKDAVISVLALEERDARIGKYIWEDILFRL